MPYLSALEVCSRQGAVQIHVYLYLSSFSALFLGFAVHCMCRSLLHGKCHIRRETNAVSKYPGRFRKTSAPKSFFWPGGSYPLRKSYHDSGAAALDYCNSLLTGENQREWTDVRDNATYAREVPGHSSRLRRTRLLLRLSRRRIFLRSRSSSIPLRSCLLPVCISTIYRGS